MGFLVGLGAVELDDETLRDKLNVLHLDPYDFGAAEGAGEPDQKQGRSRKSRSESPNPQTIVRRSSASRAS